MANEPAGPAPGESAGDARQEPRTPQEGGPRGGRILLVDDEEAVLRALARELGNAGFQVDTCSDPFAALERVQGHDYAVIVTDNRMPGLSGVELLEQVKRIAPETLRCMLTGFSDADSAIRAVNEGGIHRYLTKPWQRDEFQRWVREAIETYRLRTRHIELTVALRQQNEELAQVNTELRRLASRDRMTGLFNHAEFQDRLRRELATAHPEHPLCLAICDVDNFKAINDTHGHPVGDAVLKVLAERLCAGLRAERDAAFRYGGEEFALLFRDTAAQAAAGVLERLRAQVADVPLATPAGALSVTVSIGYGSAPGQATPEAFLAAVDAALYRAKRAGKNRVERA